VTDRKSYIGDGVYIDFDGYSLILTTEDGISVQNTVVLEPSVYSALVEYVAALREGAKTP
jgi:hypothetical protein